MIRTNQSKNVSIVDTATQSGFALTFNYNIESGKTKPNQASVMGSKTIDNKGVSLNASVTADNESVQFQGIEYDTTIATAILTELRTILNTEV